MPEPKSSIHHWNAGCSAPYKIQVHCANKFHLVPASVVALLNTLGSSGPSLILFIIQDLQADAASSDIFFIQLAVPYRGGRSVL
jgi:hypothetical protein